VPVEFPWRFSRAREREREGIGMEGWYRDFWREVIRSPDNCSLRTVEMTGRDEFVDEREDSLSLTLVRTESMYGCHFSAKNAMSVDCVQFVQVYGETGFDVSFDEHLICGAMDCSHVGCHICHVVQFPYSHVGSSADRGTGDASTAGRKRTIKSMRMMSD